MKIKLSLFIGVLFLLSGLVFVDAASAAPTSTRALLGSYDAGDPVEYTITVDVDEATTLTVNEILPAGWSYAIISANPATSTIPVYTAGSGVMSWLFSLLENDTTLTISVDSPSTCEDTTFDGNISYGDVVKTTGGDTDIICNEPSYAYYCDADNDNYISASISGTCSGTGCVPSGCQTTPGDDCNDNDESINPGADDSNCNGVNEDCSGTPDDGYVSTKSTCGDGVCAATGDLTCVAGLEVDSCIVGTPTEDPEATCDDGLDNDCDGYIDSLDSDDCQCIPTGSEDNNCDGIDDDCNDLVDDGYVVTESTCGDGVCAGNTGQFECQDGSVVDTCDPFEGAATDDTNCNGIDDDCNGLVDDGYVVTESTCGDGVCAATGNLTCVAGSVVDSCTPGDTTGDDTDCDGKDENCDGTADEGYVETQTDCGVGECAATGYETCVDGSVVDSCTPLPTPEGPEELCEDELDNDCDGNADIIDSDCGPEITVTPERVDFGCVDTDGSESRTLEITNTGNMVLNTEQVTTEVGQFKVLEDNCFGVGIAPYSSPCTVVIAFEPEQEGEVDSAVNSTDLTITSADVAEITENVPLRGTWILSAVDIDNDCIPASEDVDDNDATIASPQSAEGTGSVTIDASDDNILALSDVQSISDDDAVLNQTGNPPDYEFTDGLVSFIVEVAAPGDTVTVDITFPSLNPDDDNVYYKVDAAGFHVFSDAVFTGNTVTLTLTDGGDGDADGDANGLIVDPGGVGSQTIPLEICNDGEDNDGDNAIDCADSDCAEDSYCTTDVVDSGDSDTVDDTVDSTTGSGKKCFIATAAYGSYMADEVMALREFRDKYLMPNSLGRALVTEVYYNYSPPIADYIANHESLRTITRIALTPIVYSVKYPFVLVGMIAIGGVVVVRRQRRRK